jgi:hypothetical protein
VDAPTRAALGLGLASIAYWGFLPIAVAFGGFGMFQVSVLGMALGVSLAAAGALAQANGRGRGLLAAGFGLAGASGLAVVLLDLSTAELFLIPHTLLALAWLQGAWFAVVWATSPRGSARAHRQARRIGLTLYVAAAGFLGYLLLTAVNGFYDVTLLEVVATPGALLAARAFPDLAPAMPAPAPEGSLK